MADNSVSIVGIGLKLPGANDKIEFFEMLKEKRSGICTVPGDRWNAKEYTRKEQIPSKICTDQGGFINDAFDFDNIEFGISPNEAQDMDTHHAILLQTALHAFEDSGIAYRNTRCGAFVAGSQETANITRNLNEISAYNATGPALSVQANRLSFVFDLLGPSMYIDTACSGGLTAMHLARNSILSGDCDTALVAGVSLMLSPNASATFSMLGTLSPDGICRAFDKDANGYVRGEGCVALVLKRTADAMRDNNHIYSEITGSYINANGRGTSLTLPEGEHQMYATRRAYQEAKRDFNDAVYVECHGTGTTVGDPIEANSIGKLFSKGRTEASRLPIGSVKTNLGHLETAAGSVSLAKVALSLNQGTLLPSLNFSEPNPRISWDDFHIKVQTETEPITASGKTPDGKWVASISSFGFGGSNAHMVLEVPVPVKGKTESKTLTLTASDPLLLAVGGMTMRSVHAQGRNVSDAFANAKDTFSAARIARVATERGRGHTIMKYAIATMGTSPDFSDPVVSSRQDHGGKTLFVFSGQGAQHPEMGRALFARYGSFRDSILKSNAVYIEQTGEDFLEKSHLFLPGEECTVPTDTNGIWDIEYIIISIVMFQMALYDLWTAVGVVPDSVAGHSLGEISAMYASQALDRQQTMLLALARVRALRQLADIHGSMCALNQNPEGAEELIQDTLQRENATEGLWISAINSPSSVAVSGDFLLIQSLVELATKRGIFARALQVGGPYHCKMVDVCEASFRKEVNTILGTNAKPQCDFVSTVNGDLHADGVNLGTDYCWNNVRKPVLFCPALRKYARRIFGEGRPLTIVEIAPHGVLNSYMHEIVSAERHDDIRVSLVSSARRPSKRAGETKDSPAEVSQFLSACGEMLCSGKRDLNVAVVQGIDGVEDPFTDYNYGLLPKFPLQPLKQEIHEDPMSRTKRLALQKHPLCSPEFRISPKTHSWTMGHRIRGAIVLPGAAYLEAAFESGARTLTNVKIHRALVLLEDAPPKYCGFHGTGVSNQWAFRSSSRVETNQQCVIQDVLHCSGESHPEPVVNFPRNAEEMLGDNFLQDFDLHMSAERFYSKIKSTGSEYTREFAMITELMTSTKRERDFLCYVKPLPDLWTSDDARGMIIHPGLLDSMLLATWMYGFSFEDESKLIKDNYMPSAFEEVSLIVDPEELRQVANYLVHFTCLEVNEITSIHNMTLFDRDSGRTLLTIRRLHSPLVKDQQNMKKVAYTEIWEPRFLQYDLESMPLGNPNEEQARKLLSEVSLPATRHRTCSEALENSSQLYSKTGFADNLNDCFLDLITKLLRKAASAGRRVIRVLDVYVSERKLELTSLYTFAAKLPIHLEIVYLPLSCTDQGSVMNISDACADAGERIRLGSFDFISCVDLLRSTEDIELALFTLCSLCVPGGVYALAELNCNEITRDACYGQDSMYTPDHLRVIHGEVHTIWLQQRSKPILAPGSEQRGTAALEATKRPYDDVVDDDCSENSSKKATLCSQSNISRPSPSTLVYVCSPGTESQLVDAINELGPNASIEIWILCNDDAHGARGLALAATIQNELPSITAYGVQTNSDERSDILTRLMNLADSGVVETLTLVRDNRLYGRRIVAEPAIEALPSSSPWVLGLDECDLSAGVDGLCAHRYHVPQLEADEVLVRTEAVALNFKNVLSATGLLPSHDYLSEFGGIVEDCGTAVQSLKRGDRVMGSSNVSREGTRAIAKDCSLSQVPDNMTLQQAAAFPISYGTAYYGLIELARICEGETILVQSAAGAVGLSAIQIAQRHGLEVFCTVGSEEKKQFLNSEFGIPRTSMANSRSIAQWSGDAQRWLKERGKDGFDVVFNSLQGPALQAGLDILGLLGRFVDISKRDHLAGNPMTMRHFSKAISYFAIELGLLGHMHPSRMASLMKAVTAEHSRMPYKHLIGHRFVGAEGLKEGYKLMESGKHIGKIVVDLTSSCKPEAMTKMLPALSLFDPKKSYVLVGGCGGLGPRIVLMMITRGARKLVLTGRRGHLDFVERRVIRNLARSPMYKGLEVTTMAADALDETSMRKVFQTAGSMAPVGGIYLMTVALADDRFLNMNAEKFQRVTDSKIGALNVLLRIINPEELDFLLLFSSTAALYYNPGQANYNAAQAYFNRFASEHKNVISFAVPAITDVGVFAQLIESKGDTPATKSMLALACSSRELSERICDAIARLQSGQPVSYYIPDNLDWTVSYRIAESCRVAFSHLAEHADADQQSDNKNDVDEAFVILSKLLSLEIESIEPSAFLTSLGLDSLSASRLSAILQNEHNVKLTQLQLLGSISVSTLQTIIAKAKDADQQESGMIPSVTFDYSKEVSRLEDSLNLATSIQPFDVEKVSAENPDLHILLTGSTGYLGSALLQTLLKELPLAKFTLIIRSSDSVDGPQRLKQQFESVGRTLEITDRIKFLQGDLSKSRFALSDSDWDNLCESIDLIVQAHGRADHVAGYQVLAPVNTFATAEIIKLACSKRPKALCYIGSTNMWANSEPVFKGSIREDFDLMDLEKGLRGGYMQSKWVSEMLIRRARDRGLTSIVVRPGTLERKSKLGTAQSMSFIERIIEGCKEFGLAPTRKANYSETSVDWFSSLCTSLITNPSAWKNPCNVYHLKNNTAQLDQISTDDSSVKRIPAEEWAQKFLEYAMTEKGSKNPLAPLAEWCSLLVMLPDFSMENSRLILGDRFEEHP